MNPHLFPPRSIKDAPAARYVLTLQQNEINNAQAIRTGIEERLAAVLDVLVKTHPEMTEDLQLLADHGRFAGHADGHVQELQTLESQWRNGLPWAIKQQLAANG